MTEGQKALRKKLLAKIHQHPFCKEAKELESWTAFLQNGYGVTSSADLSIDELMNLFDVIRGIKEPKIGGVRESKEGMASPKQIYTIEKLWDEKAKDKSSLALRKFIKRTIKIMPLHLRSLSIMDASRVITAIKKL